MLMMMSMLQMMTISMQRILPITLKSDHDDIEAARMMKERTIDEDKDYDESYGVGGDCNYGDGVYHYTFHEAYAKQHTPAAL